MITYLDRQVGAVLDKLKQLGLEENTLVFFSSDNGPHREGGADPAFFHSAGPLRGFKRALYDGGIRVPMIVRWPGHVPSGATSEQVWAFWDVLPTLAELVGARPPAAIDGISMLPSIIGEQAAGHAQQNHDYLYWEFPERGFAQAVRVGNWKGVRQQPGAAIELYDLASDLSEQHDVAGAHADIVAHMEAIMGEAHTPDEATEN